MRTNGGALVRHVPRRAALASADRQLSGQELPPAREPDRVQAVPATNGQEPSVPEMTTPERGEPALGESCGCSRCLRHPSIQQLKVRSNALAYGTDVTRIE